MNYREAMDYLKELTKFGWNPGLERIEHLLSLLGNPEKDLKVIHIGGTNGKGSTLAMTSSILRAANYRVGTFISPHLQKYNERMQINGYNISDEKIAEILTYIKPFIAKMVEEGFEHPTEFEVNTAMALLYFNWEKVDFVVLEVGLGGQIDSTNVVNPLVAVLTNVSMDHMDYLGDTIGAIAQVKAGIIKENCRVVTAAQNKDALQVIEKVCQEKQVSLIRIEKDIIPTLISADEEGTVVDLKVQGDKVYSNLMIPLIGGHQGVNLATAVAAILELRHFGYELPEAAIRAGLSSVKWPGRLEILERKPMVLIDGAHNVDGARTLKNALQDIFKYEKLVLVIGMLADKEREKVLNMLGPLAEVIIVTKPNSFRAGEWQAMADLAREYTEKVFLYEDIASAIEKGKSMLGKKDMLCITGSLYMIAEAREYLAIG